jgi:glucan phosphoethanolaminetransferase (alkaline phosphatase superfamily)
MDLKKFEEYVTNRYEKEVKWYDAKSIHNQKIYRTSQWILIIFSSLTPVLIAINFGLTEYDFLKWIAVFTAIIVAVITGLLRAFKYHENWISYRNICETLKKEIHYYNANVGEYGSSNDKESLFVERVESLISRENNLWLTTFKKDRKE